MNRRRAHLGLAMLALALAACSSAPPRSSAPVVVPTEPAPVQGPSAPTPGEDGFPSASSIPPNVAETPDAVPRAEPRSASGNPPSYTVFGKTYHVLDSADGFEQVGMASWYGRKFQGKPTASGEPYNMFKMTAAHKRLPIPSYAKVTNLANGKSVIVRINDRGPFHSGRIIDLSYAAAARLDMLRKGSTRVRIEALAPDSDAPAVDVAGQGGKTVSTAYHPGTTPATTTAPQDPGSLYLQVGVFAEADNAAAMRARLQRDGFGPVALRDDRDGSVQITRVLVGPFADDAARQAMRTALDARQIDSRPYPH